MDSKKQRFLSLTLLVRWRSIIPLVQMKLQVQQSTIAVHPSDLTLTPLHKTWSLLSNPCLADYSTSLSPEICRPQRNALCSVLQIWGPTWQNETKFSFLSKVVFDVRTEVMGRRYNFTIILPVSSFPSKQGKCRDSSVDIVTRYGLDSTGIETQWGRDLPHPSRLALWPTQHSMHWYRVFSGDKAAGTWRWSPTLIYRRS
jgi:hypothetical protein